VCSSDLNETDVIINALASKYGYEQENIANHKITILITGGPDCCSIDQFQLIPDPIHVGETGQIMVRIIDLAGKGIIGANVAFYAGIGTITPSSSITDQDGKVVTFYRVDSHTQIPNDGLKVEIKLNASMIYYGWPLNLSDAKTITVLPSLPEAPIDIIYMKVPIILASIIAIVVSATVFFILFPDRINRKFARKEMKR
jgi:hypothetical protein